MQEKDVRQNENLPLEGVVGVVTKTEKRKVIASENLYGLYIYF